MVTTDQIEQKPAFRAWDRAMEWPLIAVAVVFGGAYAWQVLAEPQGGELLATQIISLAAWAVFAVDYAVRLTLTAERRRWFWRNLLSLFVVVLPILRPLRLVRLLTLFTVFQRAAGSALRGRVVIYAASTTILLVLIAALAVYQTERDAPGANITTFGDALWWACVTITTVGYGDLSPVTTEGRCIAVAMMICGIALIGTVTATIASWLVETVSTREEAAAAATQAQVHALSAQVHDLHTLLTAATTAPGARTSTAPGDTS
jgi:voltage-gated potassium channel